MDNDYNNNDGDQEYNPQDHQDSQDIKSTIQDSIIELEKELENLDKFIKQLWDNVIYDYVDDISSPHILTNLRSDDYITFYKFVINENPVYSDLIYKLNSLYKKNELLV